ncbi:MAG: RnfABCDGE type electron transport complex subunit D [Gammaproteobacteria bacterium]|nr:RnfABCDGE type electron transport complex subunit D [Gammaproteobacteria bacterium]
MNGRPLDVRRIMLETLGALVPGLLVSVWCYGWGVICQCVLVAVVALVLEALVLRLRGRRGPWIPADASVLVLAVLLGLTLPAYTPWWITIIATAFAVLIAKHAFGGLGQNVFNPAMAGYALVLVCFPAIIKSLDGQFLALDRPWQALRLVLRGVEIDTTSGATVLDVLRTQRMMMLMRSEIDLSAFGFLSAARAQWVNAAFLIGGLFLVVRGHVKWQIPVGLLGTLALLAGAGYVYDSARYAGAMLHLFAGATMLGAFFIATDPVTSATTRRGRWLFGAGVGALIYVMRVRGGYPDGVAFAVLFMNALVPWLDNVTRPRTYGDSRS